MRTLLVGLVLVLSISACVEGDGNYESVEVVGDPSGDRVCFDRIDRRQRAPEVACAQIGEVEGIEDLTSGSCVRVDRRNESAYVESVELLPQDDCDALADDRDGGSESEPTDRSPSGTS